MTQEFTPALGVSRFVLMLGLCGGLAACDTMRDVRERVFARDPAPASTGGGSLELVERDIESPDIFDLSDRAIWDGRPSFGGVWAAYSGNVQPERVRIVNLDNDKSVVGARFKREADNPGPKIELSSDAASALGVTPGQPTNVRITALRREPVEVAPENPVVEARPVITEVPLDAAPTTAITSTTGAVPSEGAIAAAPRRPKPAIDPTPAPTPAADTGPGRYIQVGTFASKANADGLTEILNNNGVTALARELKAANGRVLYRVLAGPAGSDTDLAQISDRVSALGFTDAFPVEK